MSGWELSSLVLRVWIDALRGLWFPSGWEMFVHPPPVYQKESALIIAIAINNCYHCPHRVYTISLNC